MTVKLNLTPVSINNLFIVRPSVISDIVGTVKNGKIVQKVTFSSLPKEIALVKMGVDEICNYSYSGFDVLNAYQIPYVQDNNLLCDENSICKSISLYKKKRAILEEELFERFFSIFASDIIKLTKSGDDYLIRILRDYLEKEKSFFTEEEFDKIVLAIQNRIDVTERAKVKTLTFVNKNDCAIKYAGINE